MFDRVREFDGQLSQLQLVGESHRNSVPVEDIARGLAIANGVSEIKELRIVFLPVALARIIKAQAAIVDELNQKGQELTARQIALRGCFAGDPVRFVVAGVWEAQSGRVLRDADGCY